MADNSDRIDPVLVYGHFDEQRRRKNKLTEDMVRRGLNLPADEDVNIDKSKVTNIHNHGMPMWALLLIIALMAMSFLVAYFGFGLGSRPQQPFDSSYKVLFYDKDGNPIQVPHISTRPTTDKQ